MFVQHNEQNSNPRPIFSRPPATFTTRKLWQVTKEELQNLHPRLQLVNLALAPLPSFVGSRLRVYILRAAGFQIGHGTVVFGRPMITGDGDIYRRLAIGSYCRLGMQCYLELGESITIGDKVGIGPQVMMLTTTHEIGGSNRRSLARLRLPITIGSGCWIGARCTILPGITIGAGSIVAAGALVNRDVPPNTLVAGVPARVVKQLDL